MILPLLGDDAIGRTLSGVQYYGVDDDGEDPWQRGSPLLDRLDFGLDLVCESWVVGLGWRQSKDIYVLNAIAGSLADSRGEALRADASGRSPWRRVIGRQITFVKGRLPSRDGEPCVLELHFGPEKVVLAAATYLPDDDFIVLGSDEIDVFKDEAAAERYLSSAVGP